MQKLDSLDKLKRKDKIGRRIVRTIDITRTNNNDAELNEEEIKKSLEEVQQIEKK